MLDGGRRGAASTQKRFLATSATTEKQKLTPDVPLCVTDVLGTVGSGHRSGKTGTRRRGYTRTETGGEYADGKGRGREEEVEVR